MPKKEKKRADWIITKGQLSRWQKEQRRRKQIIIAVSAVIIIVMALVIYAVYDATRPEMIGIAVDPRLPYMQVGETQQLTAVALYDNGDEKNITKKVDWAISGTQTALLSEEPGTVTGIAAGTADITITKDEWNSLAHLAVLPPVLLQINDTSFDMDYYIERLRLKGIQFVQDASERDSIAYQVWTEIQNDEIYTQLAPTLGITVTEEEMNERILKEFGPLAKTEENQEPTYEELYPRLLDYLSAIGASEEILREKVTADLLQEKIRDFIGERDVPEEMEQVHIQGILLNTSADTADDDQTATEPPTQSGTESQAADQNESEKTKDPQAIRQTILTRLEAGEDFATLAKEFSADPSVNDNEGDLGWLPRGMFPNHQVEDIAFQLDPGILSEPIPLSEAENNTWYWLIEVVEEPETRPLDEDQRSFLKQRAASKWFAEQASEFSIDDSLSPDLRGWAIEKARESTTQGEQPS